MKFVISLAIDLVFSFFNAVIIMVAASALHTFMPIVPALGFWGSWMFGLLAIGWAIAAGLHKSFEKVIHDA